MASLSSLWRLPILKLLLVLLNILTTWLTIFLSLQENRLVAMATGRYSIIRQRLRLGAVSMAIVRAEHFRIEDLPSPTQLADYTFLWTPPRDPSNVGASRTVCLTLNSNSAPVQISYYDDFWGKAARRVQIYHNSISTPYCDVLNAKPAWFNKCVADRQGNATLCHQFIVDNFTDLFKDRTVRMSVTRDIGTAGVPFLRCLGRPLVPFLFQADLLAHQTYWAGGDYHVTIQTSDCRGVPLVRTKNQDYALFQVQNLDEACDMLVLLPPGGWVTEIVPWIHAIVTVFLIIQGVVVALFHTATVHYLPHGLRIGKDRPWARYFVPFMDLITTVSGNERMIITFKGSLLVASDIWMTHWLYIWLSILDAVVNLRATYVVLQVSASLLIFKFTAGSLIFMCGALIKITWLMCLVQTLLRAFMKLITRILRALRFIRSTTREKLEWTIDGISMLLSYRVYYVLLFIINFTLVKVKGDPSFMKRAVPFKVGVYGGVEKLAGFWGSEVACDLFTLLGLLTAVGQCVGLLLLCTKYRYVADNHVMRFLQKRYMVSGWDGLLAADMLGLSPGDADFLIDGRGYTKVSIGSLLQLLYMSGPSGFVSLGGDYIFHDNGFSKEPERFRFPIPKAMAMGLLNTGNGSAVSTAAPATANADTTSHRVGSGVPSQVVRTRDDKTSSLTSKESIFDRRLHLVCDGHFGKVLLIDEKLPGQLVTNKETGHREYEVLDALTLMSILDIKHLLGREKKIRIR